MSKGLSNKFLCRCADSRHKQRLLSAQKGLLKRFALSQAQERSKLFAGYKNPVYDAADEAGFPRELTERVLREKEQGYKQLIYQKQGVFSQECEKLLYGSAPGDSLAGGIAGDHIRQLIENSPAAQEYAATYYMADDDLEISASDNADARAFTDAPDRGSMWKVSHRKQQE